MGDTNRVALRIIEESTPGTTPTSPAFEQLRITGTPNLARTPQTETTNEIRPDRQVTDLLLVGEEAGGDAGFELSSLALDTIMKGGMLSSWVRRNNRVNVGAATPVNSISSNVISVDTGAAFAVDNLIALNGFGDANDDLVFAAVATTNATTVTAASGLTDVATAPATATVRNVGVQSAAGDVETLTGPNRLTSTVLDFTTLGLTPNQWIKLGGTAAITGFIGTVANNDWVRIGPNAADITANNINLDRVPSGWTTDANTAQTIWLQLGDYIKNGTLLTQFSVEREFSDITQFEVFTGMAINTLAFQLAQQSIVTATAGMIGFTAGISGTRTSGATTIPASSEAIVNTSSNVGRIARGGTPIVGPNFVTEATIALNNGLRRQNAVGSIGAIGLGVGEAEVTGTLATYFGDATLLNDLFNNTETSLDFRFDGNTSILTTKRSIIFDMPRVKYSSGSPAVPGKNQDVIQSLGYQALREPLVDHTLLIQQFHGVQSA